MATAAGFFSEDLRERVRMRRLCHISKKIVKVIWDARNRRHFAEHERVSAETVEFVLHERQAPLQTVGFRTVEGEGERRLYHGITPSGKHLIVVTEVVGPGEVRPITRYYAGYREIKDYLEWVNPVKKSRKKHGYNNPSNGKPEWPVNGRIPRFSSMLEESKFWKQWSFADAMKAGGERAIYAPKKPAKRKR